MSRDVVFNVLGDVCLTSDNRDLADRGDAARLFGGVLGVLRQADLNIANLEAPVIGGDEQPLLKTGPNLANSKAFLDVLVASGITAFGLANNHIKDFGSDGIRSTLAELGARGVRHVGAGIDAEAARQPLFVALDGRTIGFLAFADHEFSIASATDAGATGFDPLESLDDVRAAKARCDYLVVLFHGGIEHYEYPSPVLKRKLRKIVDAGADLVTAQHSHCVGTLEEHAGGTIVYGQGNFLFGARLGDDRWNTGSILQVTLPAAGRASVRVVPVVALTGGGIDLMDAAGAAECLKALARRGIEMQDDSLIATRWEGFCRSQEGSYLPQLYGWNRYFTKLNKLLGGRLVDRSVSPRARMVTHNLIRCEAHHEVLDTLLRAPAGS